MRERRARRKPVSKDRARPFSRKHRRYWIPVTGGMILIGVINVAIGYCTYEPASETKAMDPGPLPPSSIDAAVRDAAAPDAK
jgi:hypothetical protein